MKIVLSAAQTASYGADLLEDLRASFPGVRFVQVGGEDEPREVADADAYVGLPSRDVFLAARRLRWIHNPGTGFDPIESVPELVESEIPLTNARGPHADPMADHAFAVLLTLTHRMDELRDDKRAHRWDAKKYRRRMVPITGRTMGVLAFGGIGQAVARRATGFGMRVIAVDVRPIMPPPGVEAVWGPERLDDLLRRSDVLVVTAPLTRETRGLLDRQRLELLKPGSYLIVISRGGIVDEDALVDLLRSGHIAGAGLDVFATEPLPSDSPFWELENVSISPHASASTPEMYEGRVQILKENVRRFLADEPLLYLCDKRAGY